MLEVFLDESQPSLKRETLLSVHHHFSSTSEIREPISAFTVPITLCQALRASFGNLNPLIRGCLQYSETQANAYELVMSFN